jgi:transcriptional regulator with XRE-family HTH domain
MRALPLRSRAFTRFKRTLAIRVRHLRVERGWSTREFAKRVGVGVATVRRLEHALGNPSLAVLVGVAKAARVPLELLLETRK